MDRRTALKAMAAAALGAKALPACDCGEPTTMEPVAIHIPNYQSIEIEPGDIVIDPKAADDEIMVAIGWGI